MYSFSQQKQGFQQDKKWVIAIYVLYLVSITLLPFMGIMGVIIAYFFRKDCDDFVLASHYRYQIRTFWIGLLYSVISALLTPFLFFLPALLLFIWCILRCVIGLYAITQTKAVRNENSWLF